MHRTSQYGSSGKYCSPAPPRPHTSPHPTRRGWSSFSVVLRDLLRRKKSFPPASGWGSESNNSLSPGLDASMLPRR
eukprot:6687234-Prymnesium_polylepis.1